MFRSIRSRLALSFAGIALVAAFALGAVLLAILRNYYSSLELAYLRTNAGAVGDLVAAMGSANTPQEEVQSQIKNLAFITQTRIQVFSPAGALLYDSGSPQNISVNLGGLRQIISVRAKDDPAASMPAAAMPAAELPAAIGIVPNENVFFSAQAALTTTRPSLNRIFIYNSSGPKQAVNGFVLNSDAITGDARSKLAVTLRIQKAGAPVDVRLSEGPAYGSSILNSVARGWALASAIAVLIAAAVGWFISRRISAPVLELTGVTARMAQGNLSGRAAVNSQDEFGQLAGSFNEMADQVETTVTALRYFISDAAHELRTPLTALRTNLDLALDEEEDGDRTAFITRAQAIVQRLDELSANLLDLSRLEANGHAANGDAANGHAVRMAPVDLAGVLRSHGELYASQAEQAGLNLVVELPSEPVIVQADHNQITRAMSNLVDNAIKFTPAGGTVSVTLAARSGRAVFSVADTGIGIPADELHQIFNRFHRGKNTNQYPGSGLGLAIVKAIVTLHGGDVQVASAGEGMGSLFAIELPRV